MPLQDPLIKKYGRLAKVEPVLRETLVKLPVKEPVINKYSTIITLAFILVIFFIIGYLVLTVPSDFPKSTHFEHTSIHVYNGSINIKYYLEL